MIQRHKERGDRYPDIGNDGGYMKGCAWHGMIRQHDLTVLFDDAN